MKSFKTFNLIPKFEKKRIILGFLKQKSLKQKPLKQKPLEQNFSIQKFLLENSLVKKEIFQEEEKKILNSYLSLFNETIYKKKEYKNSMVNIFYKNKYICTSVTYPFQEIQEVLTFNIEEIEEILQKKQINREALIFSGITLTGTLGVILIF